MRIESKNGIVTITLKSGEVIEITLSEIALKLFATHVQTFLLDSSRDMFCASYNLTIVLKSGFKIAFNKYYIEDNLRVDYAPLLIDDSEAIIIARWFDLI